MDMLFTEIDHVAIAVNDLEAAIAYYRDTYGCEVEHREVVEKDGIEEVLLRVADSYIQLLTPSRDASEQLRKEGEPDSEIAFVGNVMIDTLCHSLEAARRTGFRRSLGIAPRAFFAGRLKLGDESKVTTF